MATNSTYAEPESDLECVICLEVAEDPRQHEKCGRLLCKECLEKHGRDKPCPNCRMEHPQYFKDSKSKRDIQALVVECPNTGCDTILERQQVSEHISKCPHTIIPCKYEGIGCDTELERREMAAHEQDHKLHLHMALDTVNSQQGTIKSLQETVDALQDTVQTKFNGSITFAVSHYQKKKEANLTSLCSRFYTSQVPAFTGLDYYRSGEHGLCFTANTSPVGGYHMAIEVEANGYGVGEGTHVSVYAHILEGKYDARLKWPFIGSVTFTLLNQLQDKVHYTETIPFTAAENSNVNDSWGLPKFISHSALGHDPVKNTQYLKDDTLYFRVSVQVADRKPWLQCNTT